MNDNSLEISYNIYGEDIIIIFFHLKNRFIPRLWKKIKVWIKEEQGDLEVARDFGHWPSRVRVPGFP